MIFHAGFFTVFFFQESNLSKTLFSEEELAKMDSESEGADWKQEERVLAVVAYRIEKVSQLSPQ